MTVEIMLICAKLWGVQAEVQPGFAKDLESYAVVWRHLTMLRQLVKILLHHNGETVS